jgi:RNA polymerase sigma-70 factor (ECF subfamily)
VYSELSDTDLLSKLRNGDEKAYSEIYHRYKNKLYLHAYKKLHDQQQADDVIHDVFTELWLKRKTIPATNLGGYLYTAVRNDILDIISHQDVESAYIVSLQNYIEQGEAIADHRVRTNMLTDLINKEVGGLPEKMREVFELSRKLHLSHREISEKLNISEKTVKNQINNALKILRGRLAMLIFFLVLLNF